jgi:WhiB family redox-sensing transcriptional regulator
MMAVSVDLYFAAEEPWHEDAACTSYPAEMFFPPSDDPEASRAAKAVCATCPVRDECFTFALETAQSEGVWGGMDAGERRRLRRRTRDRERRRAS